MPAIDVKNLCKSFRTSKRREGMTGAIKDLFVRDYQTVEAVAGISFSVEPGELIGFIGPNGAGKSTTIKMLTGILKSTSGEMRSLGFDPFAQRKAYTQHIGVVFGQRTQLWWDIAVVESLRLLANIYRISNAEYERRMAELSEILDLKDLLKTPVRKLSLGQRIRCDLAASLIHSPKILFLDEPTIGLDAVVKVKVRQFLREINTQFKTTVLLTTHDLYEIEELCKRIIIIDKGKLIYDGALEKIKNLPGLSRSLSIDLANDAAVQKLPEVLGKDAKITSNNARRFEISYSPQQVATVELLKRIVGQLEVSDLTVSDPNIESVVMKIYEQGGITS